MATAISRGLPISAALRRWRAPPRTLSQCTVIVLIDCCCSRYTPTLGVPVSGSLVITSPRVTIRPASPGQGRSNGRASRFTCSPRNTCWWQGGSRSRSGLALSRSSSTEPKRSASWAPLGGRGCCSRASRSPSCSSSSARSMPMLQSTRSTVPIRFTATGMVLPITFSNSSAGPPQPSTRSAMAESSRSGSTGAVIRRSWPRCSSSSRKPRRSRRDPITLRKPAWWCLL